MNNRITPTNPNFLSANKKIEIGFIDCTIVQEYRGPFSTVAFSNNFVSFEDEQLQMIGKTLDIFVIFVNSKLFTRGKNRREIIIMNEKCDRKTITLWGESTDINNELLRKLSVQNLIVAFCDVKTTIKKILG
ncbi:hypothetical protein P3S68_021671 [Capsicum galapagoense]